MRAHRKHEELRILLASPGDLAKERSQIGTVIEELLPLADYVGVSLKLLQWNEVVPDMGRPQQVIFDQLKPREWDLFVGLLWHRFGTKTGAIDPKSGKEYMSGTEEEFRVAYSLWKTYGRPRIFFYRCLRPIHPSQLDVDQFKRVDEFIANFAPSEDSPHPGLYQTFDSLTTFVKRFRKDLMEFLFDHGDSQTGPSEEPPGLGSSPRQPSVETITKPKRRSQTQKAGSTERTTKLRKRGSHEKRPTYGIGFKNSKVVIALVQTWGPLPAKGRAVVRGRERLTWTSLEEIRSRTDKALEVIDGLSRLPLRPDVVVFPEYSLPLMKATIGRLQEKANEHRFVIIPGSDSFPESKSSNVYTKCPVILPDCSSPIWVTKRQLSQWEMGLIDVPERSSSPIFTWDANGARYWLSVYLSLDFTLAQSETQRGGGIFIVPMCSPDIYSFLGWADAALRLENGSATVLCNCVGEGAAGQSGVVAVAPDSRPFNPAFAFPDSKEAIAVFELDCQQLAPPKKTNPSFKFPLGRRYFYSLESTPGSTEFTPLGIGQKPVLMRGIINPGLFDNLGKKMRIAFLSATNLWEAEDKLEGQDFEVLTVVSGKWDLIITHLHENTYDMIFDVAQMVNWKTSKAGSDSGDISANDSLSESFPFFTVTAYFKVLGVATNQIPRAVASETRAPNLEEIVQIVKLGNDWNDADVSDETRERFLRTGWILGSTSKEPGKVSAIVTISLEYPDHKPVDKAFEERVLPNLVSDPRVTSIYQGKSRGLDIHYLLRVSANTDTLMSLVETIQKLAFNARILVTTSTYLVAKRLSRLSIERIALIPVLPAEETVYRNNHLLPNLSNDDRMRLLYLSETKQRVLIRQYHKFTEGIASIKGIALQEPHVAEVKRAFATGLLHEDLQVLKDPHDFLVSKVEIILREFINTNVKTKQFDDMKAALRILSPKTKNQLSFSERIRVALAFGKDTNMSAEMLNSLTDLKPGVAIRNALSHGDWERITIETYSDSIDAYCRFLMNWNLETTRLK